MTGELKRERIDFLTVRILTSGYSRVRAHLRPGDQIATVIEPKLWLYGSRRRPMFRPISSCQPFPATPKLRWTNYSSRFRPYFWCNLTAAQKTFACPEETRAVISLVRVKRRGGCRSSGSSFGQVLHRTPLLMCERGLVTQTRLAANRAQRFCAVQKYDTPEVLHLEMVRSINLF